MINSKAVYKKLLGSQPTIRQGPAGGRSVELYVVGRQGRYIALDRVRKGDWSRGSRGGMCSSITEAVLGGRH